MMENLPEINYRSVIIKFSIFSCPPIFYWWNGGLSFEMLEK